MIDIKISKRFKKDAKKIFCDKQDFLKTITKVFGTSMTSRRYRHHKLHGELKDCYACHLKPDTVLIYQLDHKTKSIYLLRIGSHAELF